MVWSFSGTRMFKKCQRQWFFKTHVASATARDPLRREAYILSKLQSIAAWRGSLVDQVISTYAIPALKRRQSLDVVPILRQAHVLFEEQVEFARSHRVREVGMTQQKGGTAYAALYPIEYGPGITEDELSQAWNEIEVALTNFSQMDDLLGSLHRATYLVTQRALSFSYNATSIRCVPDLIAFYRNEPPLIVDWKVHTYAMQNYRLQLASYAVALTQCKPHKDFPATLSQFTPVKIPLLEAQLLTKSQRRYTLTDIDIEGVYSLIAQTGREMSLVMAVDAADDLSPLDFPVTLDPDECQRCAFRSLCWEQ